MRIFLKTNLLPSSFATRGLGAELFKTIISEHEFLTGEPVLHELKHAPVEKRLPVPAKTPTEHCAFQRTWLNDRKQNLSREMGLIHGSNGITRGT